MTILPSSKRIERPDCRKCGTRMLLARITAANRLLDTCNDTLGVAMVGEVYFGVETAHSQRVAVIAAVITLGAALALCAIGLEWLRRTSAADLKFLHHLPQTRSGTSNR